MDWEAIYGAKHNLTRDKARTILQYTRKLVHSSMLGLLLVRDTLILTTLRNILACVALIPSDTTAVGDASSEVRKCAVCHDTTRAEIVCVTCNVDLADHA